MRFLICGFGSVGRRHLRNLRKLGYTDIAAYRRSLVPATDDDLVGVAMFNSLKEALGHFKPTIAIIANPTSLHYQTSLACAHAGCNIFIEKPIASRAENFDELQRCLIHHKTIAMVGYMLRFHPLFQKVKAVIEANELGPPVYARALWGEHVADWHPWEDYRASYATRPELGGGPALTLSHDIDLLTWYFGPAQNVLSLGNRAAALDDIQCYHGMDYLIEFAKGVTAHCHVDYFQRPPNRQFEVACRSGRLAVDYTQGRLYVHKRGHHYVISEPSGFDRNDMFISEMKYFIDCVLRGEQPEPSIAAAINSLSVALASSPKHTASIH
jgi:predicted dehydrogenase